MHPQGQLKLLNKQRLRLPIQIWIREQPNSCPRVKSRRLKSNSQTWQLPLPKKLQSKRNRPLLNNSLSKRTNNWLQILAKECHPNFLSCNPWTQCSSQSQWWIHIFLQKSKLSSCGFITQIIAHTTNPWLTWCNGSIKQLLLKNSKHICKLSKIWLTQSQTNLEERRWQRRRAKMRVPRKKKTPTSPIWSKSRRREINSLLRTYKCLRNQRKLRQRTLTPKQRKNLKR